MAIPGLFVEYLITGALAFGALYPVLAHRLADVPVAYVPVLVLVLYVVGMVIDFVAWAVTRPLKHMIRGRVDAKYGIEKDDKPGGTTLRHVKIAMHAPDVAKELAMRSSRDRIARGAIIIFLVAALATDYHYMCTILALAMSVLWAGFEKVSYSYEVKAVEVIEASLKRFVDEGGA